MPHLREEVREMFFHAYDGYLKYAIKFDELRPLSCDGVNTWGRSVLIENRSPTLRLKTFFFYHVSAIR